MVTGDLIGLPVRCWREPGPCVPNDRARPLKNMLGHQKSVAAEKDDV
jgi:hypothetical protein